MKDFKAFTSAFRFLICLSFVSFMIKSIGCSLEMSETWKGDLRRWPGRGVVLSLTEVIVLSAERILKCLSITPFARSSDRVSSTNYLSQLLSVVLLIYPNKHSIEGLGSKASKTPLNFLKVKLLWHIQTLWKH